MAKIKIRGWKNNCESKKHIYKVRKIVLKNNVHRYLSHNKACNFSTSDFLHTLIQVVHSEKKNTKKTSILKYFGHRQVMCV
jgi:hypothetical protein